MNSRDEPLEVLYHDNHLIAVAKPAGLPVVPDASGDESLFERAKAWIKREYEKPGAVFLGVVQRLDRPVSGVVLFARTSKAAARLTEAFREGTVVKRYLAVTTRPPEPRAGIVEEWLLKDPEKNRVRAVQPGTSGAKRAVTKWKTLEERPDGTALVELLPQTGRSHQLRVAMAHRGCPLLGDLKYGAPEALPDRSVALHAASLELEHPVRREPLVVENAAPRLFESR